MMPIVRGIGAKPVHAGAMLLAGLAMLSLSMVTGKAGLVPAMIGIGIGWASLMGNPYVMLAGAVPPERTGVYMGIFNMFIVVPMMIETLVMPIIYRPLLGGDPRNVLVLSGAMMLMAAIGTLRVREGETGARPAGAT